MNELDELDALLADVESEVEAQEAMVEESVEVEAIESKEAIDDEELDAVLHEAAINALDSEIAEEEDSEIAEEEDAVDIAELVAKPVTAKKATSKRAAVNGLNRREALLKVLGGEENAADFFVLDKTDEEAPEELMEQRLKSYDGLAKKVGEKLVNAFAYLNGGSSLSTYTSTAIQALLAEKELTSSKMVDVYANNPKKVLSVGTAKAQANQMFQLLPALGIAKRVGSKLELNENSMFLEHYKAAN